MKRILSLILAGLMAVSLLAGCSNTDNGGDTSNPDQTNQTSDVQENEGNNKGPDIEEIRKNGLPDNLIDYDAEYEEKENDEWKYRDYGTFISILGYKGTSTKIHIPDEIDGKPVLSVFLFSLENESLKSSSISITMTDNIIHVFSFEACGGALHDITLSKNLKKCGRFLGCGNLEKVVLPDGLEEIKRGAFQSCSKLVDINIPDSVKFIGYGAFFGTAVEDEMDAKIQKLKLKYPELYTHENGY